MAVEAVLLAPVLLIFLLLLVGAGRIVEAQGEVNGAARDAARAASVERTLARARTAAGDAARGALTFCQGGPGISMAGSEWREGGSVRVEVTCRLDLSAVSGFGFSPVKEMSASAVVPLERFRRVEG
ncbi:TadE/TadG family type IV pilus assembly protein [Thermopolyspora sp. NPDC052614]|uniref:TadE/TadG family type IV pilus assembly protein n=1 Tax=Thermopolyspora sp. NPDC052614 TaxID=3155682 RepID=UPI00343A6073